MSIKDIIGEQLQETNVENPNESIELKIIDDFLVKFPFLENKLAYQRPGRIIAPPLMREHFDQVFAYAAKEGGFNRFHLVIGVDDGEDLGFNYCISNQDNIILLLKEKAPKSAPQIKSVSDIFPNALWHERELVDLFGAVLEGLPDGPSYPLPDGWPKGNYPMRKEWKVEYFDRENLTYNPPNKN
ncbi:MAG: NADH-quinone oxidoreductase subunit C [Clostridiales bacterium]|jgi:Ni,Fe-hydrogenase III component G|nr:NADH-quinone oxidoreductase subunit C [Clostridiales bacterium]